MISPSVLPCDFSKLGAEVEALDAAGVDLFQWDVMDGQFVPNLTFGPDVIASARKYTNKPFEAHLMVLTPDVLAQRYVDAGCSRLIVHAEACPHLHRTLGNINSMGANAAVALNPHTPISEIEHVLDLVDMVLVMTVNPGFGGQSYIASMEPKIRELKALIDRRGLSEQVNIGVVLRPKSAALQSDARQEGAATECKVKLVLCVAAFNLKVLALVIKVANVDDV